MDDNIIIANIEFLKPSLDLPVGGEKELPYEWQPAGADTGGIEWEFPPDICEVRDNGGGTAIIKGLKPGDATVAVSAGEARDSMRVRVRPMVEKIILSEDVIKLRLGQRRESISVKFLPTDAYYPDITAIVADEKIVMFRGRRLFPVREGETFITVKSGSSGVTAKCKVVVESAGFSKGGIGMPMYIAMMLMVLSFTLPFPYGQFAAATSLLVLCYAYWVVKRFTVEILVVMLASLASVFRGYIGL